MCFVCFCLFVLFFLCYMSTQVTGLWEGVLGKGGGGGEERDIFVILFYWKLQLALQYPLPSSREKEQTEKKGSGGDSFFWTVLVCGFLMNSCATCCGLLHVINSHIGRLCRLHSKSASCLCYSLCQGEFTGERKRVVNRLKIPQGLSTLLFRRWSEVPSRGGVRGDSP